MVTGFASTCFINMESYKDSLRSALVLYFCYDTYKNNHKRDIVLHHITCTLMSIIAPFEYIQKLLLLEFTTIFLLLYKKGYPTKIPFLISWIGLRLVYTPYVIHPLIHTNQMYVIPITVMHGLHFHWSCKIIDTSYDTRKGVSSLLLFLSVLNSDDAYTIYIQTMSSFLFHTTQYNIFKTIDTTCIAHFSLKYLNITPIASFFVCILQARFETRIHQWLFLCAVAKLISFKPFVLYFVILAIYGFYQKKVWVWHLGTGLCLASRQ
jgi:hypothetical protein